MFDYYEFDPVAEEGLLRPSQVNRVRKSLEDLIDIIYDPSSSVDEEIDLQIRKIASELGVYVPSNSKFERFGGYYIESQIKLLYKLEDLYFIFRDKEKAKEHLSIRIDDFEKLGLTELDISNFCDSDFYSDRCKKVLDNIHNGVESVL